MSAICVIHFQFSPVIRVFIAFLSGCNATYKKQKLTTVPDASGRWSVLSFVVIMIGFISFLPMTEFHIYQTFQIGTTEIFLTVKIQSFMNIPLSLFAFFGTMAPQERPLLIKTIYSGRYSSNTLSTFHSQSSLSSIEKLFQSSSRIY